MKVFENILISSITTMRLGGAARYMLHVEKPEDVPDAYGFAETYNLPVFPLGSGANTIGHDEGYNGVIVINTMRGITLEGTTVKAMGGEIWDNVVSFACEHGLTGIEALSKIPGTAGAAPVQNIGAYGQDISQVLDYIEVYDTVDRAFKTLKNEDLKFEYRKSILNSTEHGRYFVISIALKLKTGEMARPFYNSIERYIAENNITDFSPASVRNIVSAIRDSKLPDPAFVASSGSFFKNVYVSKEEAENLRDKDIPVYNGADGYKINSGWLIEKAGFSGELLHGIRVSDKASLVLINESAEGYNDLAAARDEIVAKVYDKFGFWLEQEPVEIK